MRILIKVSIAIFILSTVAVAFASQKNQFIPTNTLYSKRTVYWHGYGYEEITQVAGKLNYNGMTCKQTAPKRFFCFVYTHVRDSLVYRTICRFVVTSYEVRISYKNWRPRLSYEPQGRDESNCWTNLYLEVRRQ